VSRRISATVNSSGRSPRTAAPSARMPPEERLPDRQAGHVDGGR
jgi:hypothetical protein